MWIITRDFLEDGRVAGVCSADYVKAEASTLSARFQLLDADGELYFEGIADDDTSQRAFDPLDNFGRGYAGCVEIRYLSGGSWRPL